MLRGVQLPALVVALGAGLLSAAGTVGLLAQGMPRSRWWEEWLPMGLMLLPYAAGLAGVFLAAAALVLRRKGTRRLNWLSQGPWIHAAILVTGTALLLGPVGAFHHMFRFGLLGYMVVDCESEPQDLPIPFGRCGIRASALGLVVSLAVWVIFLGAMARLRRLRSARGAGLAAEG